MADIFTPAERDRIWETAVKQAIKQQRAEPEPPLVPPAEPPENPAEDPLFQVAVDIYCAIRTAAHHEDLNLRKGPF